MHLSPELITFFAAMLPFVELKLAIPLGLELGLTSISTFIFAVSGTILPAAILLALIKPATLYFRKRHKKIDTFCYKIFNKTQKEHSKQFARYGALFLILFVAIPVPGSGTVAGSLIAFVFGVDYWKAISLIILGSSFAGMLLIAGFGGVFAIINHFV